MKSGQKNAFLCHALKPEPETSPTWLQDDGYSPGAMAALGIIMLLLTMGGVVALLIWVLKWWRVLWKLVKTLTKVVFGGK